MPKSMFKTEESEYFFNAAEQQYTKKVQCPSQEQQTSSPL